MKNFSFQNKKAFSLIELLIVIAIIGILSTIVLTTLSKSRAKAFDAKVMMQLRGFRAAAENYFTSQDPNRYTNVLGTPDSDCSIGMFNDVEPQHGSPQLYIAPGNLPDGTQIFCGATDFAYAVKATLYSNSEYWCIDNKGFSGLISGTPVAGTSCP